MMVSMETYLRRGWRTLQRLSLSPRLRTGALGLCYGGSGFLLGGVGLLGLPQPLALGLICGAGGWRAVLIGLGAVAGYVFFWGEAGRQGVVWAAAGTVLSVLVGPRRREAPLLLPFAAALLQGTAAVCFRFLLGDGPGPAGLLLWSAVTLGSTMLFMEAFSCRDAVTDWLIGGIAVLALAQTAPRPWANAGYVLAALVTVGGAFPAAALTGLGLDLAGSAPVSMTAALALAYLVRLFPLERKWQHYTAPALGYLALMALGGIRDYAPLPGLLLGGCLGMLLPPRPQFVSRRGGTGMAQVRLELGAQVLSASGALIAELEAPPIDVQGLLDKARDRACGNCSARKSCPQRENFGLELLENPLDADCRKPGRLVPELHRAREQWKELKLLRRRQGEYRRALLQQYRFLSGYLRGLADRLPRMEAEGRALYRVEASARSRGKTRANGDRCLAFPGPGLSYYVLLCDGMGTGLGAAQAGREGAVFLRRMLQAGFPPEHALRSYNSILALRDAAGEVTVDLAQVRVDTGLARVYKWGAAPSWVLGRKGGEKIGTATPPPGLSVGEVRESAVKLSLRRGEALILLSDGVDGEDVLRHSSLSPDLPPGELAAEILERCCGGGEDDATAAVIRLRPANLGIS